MRIQLLMTGSELMSGTTVDSNSARIADALAGLGLSVYRKVTVGDDKALLIHELQTLANDSDVIIVNGGLGPTSDDLTAEALAAAKGETLSENAAAIAHIEQWCEQRRVPLNAANRKQAMLPTSAFVIANRIGSAVGFAVHLGKALVLCTPGVPRELESMLAEQILPLLQQQFPAAEKQQISRMHLFGVGESQAQEMIDAQIPQWPEGVTLGFRAGMPTVEIKLFVANRVQAVGRTLFEKLQQIFADSIVALHDQNMAAALLDLLAAQGKTLACAESCTGGLISSMLTEVAGSSRVFTAGFITYSNAMKTAMLGVDENLLQQHGAVSEATAHAMLQGALQKSAADYAVAVTGIAGPNGGSPEKPVGTVWIAWGTKNQQHARCLVIPGPRKRFQQLTAAIALDAVRRQASNLNAEPGYFGRWGYTTPPALPH